MSKLFWTLDWTVQRSLVPWTAKAPWREAQAQHNPFQNELYRFVMSFYDGALIESSLDKYAT